MVQRCQQRNSCQSRGNASTATAAQPEIHVGASAPRGCPNLTAHAFLNPGTRKYYSILHFTFFYLEKEIACKQGAKLKRQSPYENEFISAMTWKESGKVLKNCRKIMKIKPQEQEHVPSPFQLSEAWQTLSYSLMNCSKSVCSIFEFWLWKWESPEEKVVKWPVVETCFPVSVGKSAYLLTNPSGSTVSQSQKFLPTCAGESLK